MPTIKKTTFWRRWRTPREGTFVETREVTTVSASPAQRDVPHGKRWVRSTTGGMPGEGRSFFYDVVIPGAVTGFIAGTLMLLVYMIGAAALGQGFFAAPKMIGGVFWRNDAVMFLGFWPIIAGLIVHYAVSCGLATAFALMLPRGHTTEFALFPLALLYSVLVYIALIYFVMPYVSPPMRHNLIYPLWFIAHAVWGAILPLVQPLRRVLRPYERVATLPYRREVHV